VKAAPVRPFCVLKAALHRRAKKRLHIKGKPSPHMPF